MLLAQKSTIPLFLQKFTLYKMINKYSILFLFFWLLAGGAWAQTGTVKGRVLDEKTGESIPGVTVQIAKSSIGTATDDKGNFTLNEVALGEQKLLVSFVGYRSYELRIFVSSNKDLILPNIRLAEEGIGLREVEVFASFVDEKRQPPTPVSTITAIDIEEKMGAQEFPEILKSTPGVFVNTGGGNFGDASVRVRGFASENTAVMINGVPVNDMENGRVFWSNWGGMNDVTYNKQVQRGLGASKLAVSSVGGTINILTKPSEFRKGVKLTYGRANRAWENFVMVSASTGLMENGWAVTALASSRWGDGFREGTGTEAYSYFLTVSKNIGKRHQIMFTGFGAPQRTDRGSNATELTFQTVGRRTYNPGWGFITDDNGKVSRLNAFQNRYHKPMFMLNHYFDINEKMTLSTGVYYSNGQGGGTNIGRGPGTVNPIAVNLGSGTSSEFFQINWDGLREQNLNNPRTIYAPDGSIVTQGNESRYILQEARNDHDWLGGISTLNVDFNENFSATFGVDYRWYRGYHYRLATDLLGGDFFIDRNRNSPINGLRNRANPFGIVRQGERMDYDYNGTVQWAGAFAQLEYSLKNVDLFLTTNYVNSSFQRNGRFLNDDFVDSSLGKSDLFTFNNYTVKAGLNYKITGRHNVFFNSGLFTRAPFFRDAFVDNRYSNDIRGNLNSETIRSLELGYGYRSPRFAANVNLYRTNWEDQAFTELVFTTPNSDFAGDILWARLSDVDALHMGVEVDWTAKLTQTLSMTGMLSIGDWRWANDAQALILTDPGLEPVTDNQPIYIGNLKVGGVAQTTMALGMRYNSPKFWYVGAGANYYDNIYADYNPQDRLNRSDFFRQVQKLPAAFTLDIYGGKSWKFGGTRLQLRGNINNLLDNQFIIDSRQRNDLDPLASPFVQYFLGRTYYVSATISI
jgi:hypothetical protein